MYLKTGSILLLIQIAISRTYGEVCEEIESHSDVVCVGVQSVDDLKEQLKTLNSSKQFNRLFIDESNFDTLSIDPENIWPPQKFTTIGLRSSNITAIPSNAFHSSEILKQITIEDCDIQNIASDAFLGLKNVIWLHLNDNSFITLPENLFSHLDSVQILVLAGNELENIASTELGKNLVYLDLSRNNIKKLVPNMFVSGLSVLLLNDNEITEVDVDTFKGLINLQHLELRNNTLKSLPDNIFANNPNLKCLKLDSDVPDPIKSDPSCTIFGTQ